MHLLNKLNEVPKADKKRQKKGKSPLQIQGPEVEPTANILACFLSDFFSAVHLGFTGLAARPAWAHLPLALAHPPGGQSLTPA